MKIDINTLKNHLRENADSSYFLRHEDIEKCDNFTITCEDYLGGSEGAGEEHWVVIKVTDGIDIQYFEIPGYYQSYDGAYVEIDNLFEVEPYEKTVRDWRKV